MNVTQKLQAVGACWAVRSDKYVSTNDGFGVKPSYHIHPHSDHPHQRDILRFYTLTELNKYLDARIHSDKAGKAGTVSEQVEIMDDYWASTR